MIPELGSFALILALCFALIQGTIRSELTVNAVFGQFTFLSFAMLCLIISFINNDMSVIYVREHSHHLLPFIYRVGAAWGGHEGSLLLWCLVLSAWTFAFIIFSDKKLSKTTFSTILMILGWMSAGFILFLLSTSNPFQRDFPLSPIIGNDLTPVLQDPGLIFHPPMLYSGYVGFAIAFAFAIAALLEGKFNKEWARALRPWIILPWSFLSFGIVLGSWWAYRELGWGGWWFWDPVENASLLPWLAATALLHSLIVSEKRSAFKGWTLLLAIITYALSLLGTFLVRSGVLVSVHAFANDPRRGLFLLGYIALIIGGALALYSIRIKKFFKPSQFQLFSRETFLLINSVILLTAVATITLGTLYPIVLEALNLEKISIGEPYFNTVFVPIMLPALLLMGLAPHVHWEKQSFLALWKKMGLALLLSLLLAFLLPWSLGYPFGFLTWMGISLGLWILLSTLQSLLKQKTGLNHWAMIVAHMGIAILVIGVSVNKSYSEERQVKMQPGESIMLAGYQFTFDSLDKTKGPNFESIKANFTVGNEPISAEQRIYPHDQTLGKTGIIFNGWRDLYLALGNSLPDGNWSIRIYYKPCVRWIWFGGFMLLIGGMISLLNHYQKRRGAL